MYFFGNNWSDGFTAKPYEYNPTWEKQVDYSPDHQPSSSAMISENRETDFIWLWQVKGIGVIVVRSSTSCNDPHISIFTKEEIGFKPDL